MIAKLQAIPENVVFKVPALTLHGSTAFCQLCDRPFEVGDLPRLLVAKVDITQDSVDANTVFIHDRCPRTGFARWLLGA